MDLTKQLEIAERARSRQLRMDALAHACALAQEEKIFPERITGYAEDFMKFLEGPQRDD